MKTVTKIFAKRLELQIKEAKIQGMNKTASALESVLSETQVRDNNDNYTYNETSLIKDVEKPLWESVIRVADYHNANFDVAEVNDIIEKAAESFIAEVRSKIGAKHGVGAFETTTPGEDTEQMIVEID